MSLAAVYAMIGTENEPIMEAGCFAALALTELPPGTFIVNIQGDDRNEKDQEEILYYHSDCLHFR